MTTEDFSSPRIVRRGVTGAVARPVLFGLLERAARVTVVSAPAGSRKTALLRSWIDETGLRDRAAWLTIERVEHDVQKFWTGVVEALRATARGSQLLHLPDPAPSFKGWTVVERLLKELAALDEPLWLVISDMHELRSEETLRQLELLLLRAPKSLRFVVSTRHDLRLGLHRLRLENELTEIRDNDLRFGGRDISRVLRSWTSRMGRGTPCSVGPWVMQDGLQPFWLGTACGVVRIDEGSGRITMA